MHFTEVFSIDEKKKNYYEKSDNEGGEIDVRTEKFSALCILVAIWMMMACKELRLMQYLNLRLINFKTFEHRYAITVAKSDLFCLSSGRLGAGLYRWHMLDVVLLYFFHFFFEIFHVATRLKCH